MEFFTLGDFIVLGLVLIIILLFRQLDKNNRSMEKVKRFSDKIKGELSEYAEQKLVEVKDLGIELEVQQKTGKEILKRITGTEESLNARVEGLEGMDQRLAGYDHSINELYSLTSRVEENLKRIKDESAFVDSVGKQIKDASGKLTRLSKSIPAIGDEFRQYNDKELSQIKESFSRETEDRLKQLEARLGETDQRVAGYRNFLENLEAQQEDYGKQTLDVFRKGTLEQVRNSKESLNGLQNEILQRIEQERSVQFQALEQEETAFSDRLKQLRQSFAEEMRQVEEAFTAKIQTAVERGLTFEDEAFDAVKAAIESRVEQERRVFEERMVAQKSSGDQLLVDMNTQYQTAVDQVAETLNRSLDGWQQNWSERVEDESREMRLRLESLDDRVNKADVGIDDHKKKQIESMDLWFEELGEQKDDMLTQCGEAVRSVREDSEQLQTDLDELKVQYEQKFVETRKDLEQRLFSDKEALDQQQAQFLLYMEERQTDFGEQKDSYAEKLTSFEQDVADQMARVGSDLEVFQQEIRGKIDSAELRFEQELRQTSDGIEQKKKEVGDWLETASTDIQGFRDKVHSELDEVNSSVILWKDEIQENVSGSLNTLNAEIERKSEYLAEKMGRLQQNFNEEIHNNKEDLEQLSKGIDSLKEESLGRLNDQRGQIEAEIKEALEALENKQAEIEEKLGDVSRRSKDRVNETAEDFQGHLKEIRDRLDQKVVSMNQEISSLELLASDISRRNEALTHEAEDISRAYSDRLDTLNRDVTLKISKATESIESSIVEGIEERLAEYERMIQYRFEKIEVVASEMDVLEENIRSAVTQVQNRTREELQVFNEGLHSEQQAEKQQRSQEMSALTAEMQAVEQRLAELKTTAYQNVSEKLQIFEDEFTSSLAERNQQIDQQLSSWKQALDTRLDEYRIRADEESRQVETERVIEFGNRIDGIRNDITEKSQKLSERVKALKDEVDARIETSQALVTDYSASLENEVSRLENATGEYLSGEMSTIQTRFSNKIGSWGKELETRVASLGDDVEVHTAEIKALVESSRLDIVHWQKKVQQQLKDSEGELVTGLENFKATNSDQIRVLQEDYAAQRNEIVIAGQEDRARIRQDVEALEEKIAALDGEINKRTDQSLDRLQKEYENFLLDFQKKSHELQGDFSEKLSAVRNGLQDTREKVESLHSGLVDKMNQDYQSASENLSEIEKQQKNFISQTRLFDRADSLKEELSQEIEGLSERMASLENRKKDLSSLETGFTKIRELGNVINGRHQDILQEEERLNRIEGEFQKVMSLSETIETKLAQVTHSHDTLQEIQMKLKNLGEMEKDISSRYDRLEKKKELVDSMIGRVDKNFEVLDGLEKMVNTLQGSLEELPPRLVELEKNFSSVSRGKEEVFGVVNQLKTLKDTLRDIEVRTEKMEQAREWLARTETRLEAISQQAQDQVRLLGSLVEQGSGQRRTEGSPSMDIRETVTRLAHQNWSVEEIASATKLSRGEVELILELSQQ